MGQFSSYRRDPGASQINRGSALGLSCLQTQGLCDLTPPQPCHSPTCRCCPTRYQFSDHLPSQGTVMAERHWPSTDQKDALESPRPRGLRSPPQRLMIASSDTSSGHRTQRLCSKERALVPLSLPGMTPRNNSVFLYQKSGFLHTKTQMTGGRALGEVTNLTLA